MISVQSMTVRVGASYLLHNVDLDVEDGEVLALAGPNGAGKSTLLGVLWGWTRPTEGEVLLRGRPLATCPTRQRTRTIAVLPQSPVASDGLLVREVLALGLRRTLGTADRALIEQVLTEVGLQRLTHRTLGSLSGGERQRVHLARVLAQADATHEPCLLLLDEPTASQDPGRVATILDALRKRARAGHTVVVVLHDLIAASFVADRIALLAQGRLVKTGSPSDTLTPALLSPLYGAPLDILVHPGTGRPVLFPTFSKES